MGTGELLAQPSLIIGCEIPFRRSGNTHGGANLQKSEDAPHSYAGIGPSTELCLFVKENTKPCIYPVIRRVTLFVTLFLSTVRRN